MQIEKISENNVEIVHIVAKETVIRDLQSALDLMMTVQYETGINNIAISQNLIVGSFLY